jgi:hypothetical protein
VGVVVDRLRVTEDSGKQAAYRFTHDQNGRLPAGQDVVADAQLPHLRCVELGYPRIDPLVAATGKHQMVHSGQFLGDPLGEHLPGRSRDDQGRTRGQHLVEGLTPRLRAHDHARTTAVRRVVHGAVTVMGEVT